MTSAIALSAHFAPCWATCLSALMRSATKVTVLNKILSSTLIWTCFPPRLVGVDFPLVSPTKSCLPLLSGLLLSSTSCGCRLPPSLPYKVLSSTLIWTCFPPRLVGVDFPLVSPTKSCFPLLSGLAFLLVLWVSTSPQSPLQSLVFHSYLDSCFPPRRVGVDFPQRPLQTYGDSKLQS